MKNWISRMLSEGDGSPSTKRVLFAIAVVACLFFGWIEHSVELLKSVLLTTGGAYVGGRFAEISETGASPALPTGAQKP